MTQLEKKNIIYPESDGLPMAENTRQYSYIVLIKEGLEVLFSKRPDVFIAADLFWYPVEGDNGTRVAPDVMVALGRPKGDRGSYQQWREAGIPPQVVFEILSPGNSGQEMRNKLDFYQRYGVKEYYVYDPDNGKLEGWQRHGEQLVEIKIMQGWVSPLLGIRFELEGLDLKVYGLNGKAFISPGEMSERATIAEQRLDYAEQRLDYAEQRLSYAEQRLLDAEAQLETERQRAEKLAALLKQLNPDLDV